MEPNYDQTKFNPPTATSVGGLPPSPFRAPLVSSLLEQNNMGGVYEGIMLNKIFPGKILVNEKRGEIPLEKYSRILLEYISLIKEGIVSLLIEKWK